MGPTLYAAATRAAICGCSDTTHHLSGVRGYRDRPLNRGGRIGKLRGKESGDGPLSWVTVTL